jgi:microcystin degradation protein MlrC
MQRGWRRWLFYVDVLVFAVFAIATVYMAKDAYWAGYYRSAAHVDMDAHSRHLWYLARDVAFQVAALAWIFYRLFACQLKLLRKP